MWRDIDFNIAQSVMTWVLYMNDGSPEASVCMDVVGRRLGMLNYRFVMGCTVGYLDNNSG